VAWASRRRRKATPCSAEDSGKPIARLRPTGKGDQVEVMWWSHREKWDQIGDFGPMVMPLDEALEYVTMDPMGCFWH